MNGQRRPEPHRRHTFGDQRLSMPSSNQFLRTILNGNFCWVELEGALKVPAQYSERHISTKNVETQFCICFALAPQTRTVANVSFQHSEIPRQPKPPEATASLPSTARTPRVGFAGISVKSNRKIVLRGLFPHSQSARRKVMAVH